MKFKGDPIVALGGAVVGVTAIVASFSTLIGLAHHVGWEDKTAFLFPACIDVLALAAGRVWLNESATLAARTYGRKVSMVTIAISILGNATGHIVNMHNASPIKVILAIIVGSIPPAALAAVGHLYTLATMHAEEPVAEAIVAESIESSVQDIVKPEPVKQPVFLGMPAVRQPEPVHVVLPRTETRGRKPVKEPIAWSYWQMERAAGRTPRPIDLANAADADPKMGSRWLEKFQRLEKELQSHTTTKTGATLTLVTT